MTPKLEKALECFKRAVEPDPGSPVASLNRGAVLARMGRLEEALACFDRTMHLKEWEAKDEWMVTVLTRGRPRQTEGQCQHVLESYAHV
jgi:tetratricopeptide (TPR) repeat protein